MERPRHVWITRKLPQAVERHGYPVKVPQRAPYRQALFKKGLGEVVLTERHDQNAQPIEGGGSSRASRQSFRL